MSARANRRVRARFGKNLKRARKAARLSQDDLGRLSGLSGKFVGECERGEKSISLDSLHMLARALRVSVADLIGGAR